MFREKEEIKRRIIYNSHELTKLAPLMPVLTRLVLKLRRLALLLTTFAMVLILLLTFPTPRAAPTPAVSRPPAGKDVRIIFNYSMVPCFYLPGRVQCLHRRPRTNPPGGMGRIERGLQMQVGRVGTGRE